MSLDGLHQQDVVLVCYSESEWYHERCLLGFVGDCICVVTPIWDMYVEQVADVAPVQAIAQGGARTPPCPRVVRFDRAELRRRFPQLLLDARAAEPQLEEEPPVGTAAARAADGAAEAPTVWVAMENRAGFKRGDPVHQGTWQVTAAGDRGVAVSGSSHISVGTAGTLEVLAVPPGPKPEDEVGGAFRPIASCRSVRRRKTGLPAHVAEKLRDRSAFQKRRKAREEQT